MTLADWCILAVLVLSVVQAASQGFFLEVFSLAGVVVGFLLASWEYSLVASRLQTFVNPPWVADIAGFLIVFLVVALLAGVIGRILSWGVRQVGLRWADRVLGAAFGLLRGVLVVMVFTVALAAFDPGSRVLANSELAPYFLVAGRAATWLAPGDIRNRVRDGLDVLNKAKLKAEDAGKPASTPNAAGAKGGASSGAK